MYNLFHSSAALQDVSFCKYSPHVRSTGCFLRQVPQHNFLPGISTVRLAKLGQSVRADCVRSRVCHRRRVPVESRGGTDSCRLADCPPGQVLAVIKSQRTERGTISLTMSISVTRLCSLAVGESGLSALPKYASCVKYVFCLTAFNSV